MHFFKCRQQMSPGHGTIFKAFLLIGVLVEITGEEIRQLRSINYQTPLQNSPLNFPVSPAYSKDIRNDNRLWISSNSLSKDRRREFEEREEKLFQTIVSKDYGSSSRSDIEQFDRIGDRMIERANLTDDAKRVVRQVKKQRPGFFWTLARVAFETVNETRSAFQQLNDLISTVIEVEPMPKKNGKTKSGAMKNATTTEPTTTDSSDSTTTEEPFKLSRNDLQRIIRRNWQGLVRLFNLEWRDAINQSQINVREFQRDLGDKISPFLQDNPDVV